MSQHNETLDITLLRNNKNEFIIRCQKIISIIVKQYIAKRMFSSANFDDIKQSVTLELIKRLPLIEKNYNGTVLLHTYVNVVIMNICLRIYENESSGAVPLILSEHRMLSDENAEDRILISNELERLKIALKLFHSQQFKILVCVKVYFSIPITSLELRQCFPGITINDHYHLLNAFKNPHPSGEEFINFSLLTTMLNKYGQASATEESVRRMTLAYIQKLLHLMNGNPPSRAHTKDSLKVLLERASDFYTEHD